MSARDTGGAAFPQLEVVSSERDGHGDVIEPFTSSAGGMTLRDWFAAQALFCASQKTNGFDPQWLAATAYIIADAMLREREK